MAENMIRHTIRIRESVEPEIYAELSKQQSGVASIRRLLSLAKTGLMAERMYLSGNVAVVPVAAAPAQPMPAVEPSPAASSKKSPEQQTIHTDMSFTEDFDALDMVFERAINEHAPSVTEPNPY